MDVKISFQAQKCGCVAFYVRINASETRAIVGLKGVQVVSKTSHQPRVEQAIDLSPPNGYGLFWSGSDLLSEHFSEDAKGLTIEVQTICRDEHKVVYSKRHSIFPKGHKTAEGVRYPYVLPETLIVKTRLFAPCHRGEVSGRTDDSDGKLGGCWGVVGVLGMTRESGVQ